jgi:long-chain acyl-CoA synthetase
MRSPDVLNLAVLLEDSARRFPQRTAVVTGADSLTFSQLDATASQVAGVLRVVSVRPDDVVTRACPNRDEFAAVYFGVLRAGAVVVTLNALLREREIAEQGEDSRAKVYFCYAGSGDISATTQGWPAAKSVGTCQHFIVIADSRDDPSPIAGVPTLAEALRGQATSFPGHRTRENDTAAIVYTSGTTGQPKGVELSHGKPAAQRPRHGEAVRHPPRRPRPLPRGPAALPHSGADLHDELRLRDGGDPGHAPAVRCHAGTGPDGRTSHHPLRRRADQVLAMLRALPEGDGRSELVEHVRISYGGAAPLPAEIIREIREQFGVQISEGYGLTGPSPLVLFADPREEYRQGSTGKPIWRTDRRIVDERGADVPTGNVGELVVRGHLAKKGILPPSRIHRQDPQA